MQQCSRKWLRWALWVHCTPRESQVLFWGDWSPSLAATFTKLLFPVPMPSLTPSPIMAPSAHPSLLTPLPYFVFSEYHRSHSCEHDLIPSRIESPTIPGLWAGSPLYPSTKTMSFVPWMSKNTPDCVSLLPTSSHDGGAPSPEARSILLMIAQPL